MKNRVETCWLTLFDSGSEWAAKFKSEIQRVKELRAQAITAAGLETPANEIFENQTAALVTV
jgi:hypothetical protein